jgi:hypothetical protein
MADNPRGTARIGVAPAGGLSAARSARRAQSSASVRCDLATAFNASLPVERMNRIIDAVLPNGMFGSEIAADSW